MRIHYKICSGVAVGVIAYTVYREEGQYPDFLWIFFSIVASLLVTLGLAYKALLYGMSKLEIWASNIAIRMTSVISSLIVNSPSTLKPFQTALFNDPVADEVSWQPLRKGGFGIFVHRLFEVSPRIYIFRVGRMGIVLPLICMAIGTGLFLRVLLGFGVWFIELLIATLFFLAGLLPYLFWSVGRVFHLDLGYYWRGRKVPGIYDFETTGTQCRISEIHALQIIDENCNENSDRSSYLSYELNLVLVNKSRIHVIDHIHLAFLQEDAAKLSKFLNIPLWDATIYKNNI